MSLKLCPLLLHKTIPPNDLPTQQYSVLCHSTPHTVNLCTCPRSLGDTGTAGTVLCVLACIQRSGRVIHPQWPATGYTMS